MRKVEVPLLEVSNIFKSTKKCGVRGFNLNVGRSDCVAVLHKSEKSADLVIDIISGRIEPEKGKVFFKGDNINGVRGYFGVAEKKLEISKNKTVADNAASALVKRGLSRHMSGIVVAKDIKSFGLQDYIDMTVKALPKNIAARADIYAAYMWSHEFIVINEPFSTLDGDEKTQELEWLKKTAKSNKLAMAVFTEDIDTAIKLGTTVMVVDKEMRSLGMIGVNEHKPEQTKERLLEIM